jgi:hypothetical protein
VPVLPVCAWPVLAPLLLIPPPGTLADTLHRPLHAAPLPAPHVAAMRACPSCPAQADAQPAAAALTAAADAAAAAQQTALPPAAHDEAPPAAPVAAAAAMAMTAAEPPTAAPALSAPARVAAAQASPAPAAGVQQQQQQQQQVQAAAELAARRRCLAATNGRSRVFERRGSIPTRVWQPLPAVGAATPITLRMVLPEGQELGSFPARLLLKTEGPTGRELRLHLLLGASDAVEESVWAACSSARGRRFVSEQVRASSAQACVRGARATLEAP